MKKNKNETLEKDNIEYIPKNKKEINRANTLERLLSFIIDMFIVSTISLVLTFWMPLTSNYHEASKKMNDINNQRMEGKITEVEWVKERDEQNYIMKREYLTQTAVGVVVLIAYYVTYTYYNNGQTLGKKIVKIKVVNEEGKTPSQLHLLLRAGIINSVFLSILSPILIMFLSKDNYISYFGYLSSFMSIIMLSSLLMIAIRNDKRGVHDLVSSTDVVKI